MKKVTFLILTLIALNFSYSQVSFSHAAGIKAYIGTGDSFTEESYSSVGLLYSPRLNLVEVGNSSTISIGTHLGLAFQGNSRTGTSFVYDLPLVAEYNYGHASNTDNDDGFGFYIGGGYALHNSSQFLERISGPVANAGARFAIAERTIDVNLSYLLGIGSEEKNSIIGVGLQYTFGM